MRWIPLEANPEFLHKLGIKPGWEFLDVYGLDAELLAMIPKPVLAVLLLYPLTKSCDTNELGQPNDSSDLLFIKQTVGNACGTVALLHAIMNNNEQLEFHDRSLIDDLLKKTQQVDSQTRGTLIENDEAPDSSTCTDLHFICFTESGGNLYELDGRKKSPVLHCATKPGCLLEDSAVVIKEFMARSPQSMNFAVIALCKTD